MAELPSISYTLVTSPRIAESPSTVDEVTVQDALDTLSAKQDDIDVIGATPAIDNTVLVSGSGKDDLGGGTSVGITSTFDNLQWAFASDYAATESGTATSVGTTTLIDTLATFVTNGVVRGSVIINYDDKSITEVLTVDSETQLTHRPLNNGVANDWTIGDNYTVHNIIQKNLTGGNQVAVDSLGSSISPIYPTAFTQVILTASSSATLQNQEQLESATFIGKEGLGFSIDPINGTDSTTFPYGNSEHPCKTETNLIALEAERPFRNFYLKNSITITTDHSGDPNVWFGDNPISVQLNADPGADLTGNKFQDLNYTGTGFLNVIYWESIILPITGGTTGFIYNCACIGPVAVGSGVLNVVDSWDGNAPGTPVTFDMSVATSKLSTDNFKSGVIKITNLTTAGQYADININNCEVIIDSTCTLDDAITIAGAGKVTNNSTAQIDTSNLFEPFGLDVIYIDTIDGVAGTQHPIGRKLDPVDNLTDATTIATANNAEEFRIRGQVTALQGYSNVDFSGKQEIVDFTAGLSGDSFNLGSQVFTGVTFQNLVLTGDMTGSTNCKFKNCYFLNVTGITGTAEYCGFGGDCSIEGGGYVSATYTVFEGEASISCGATDATTFSFDSVSGYIFIYDMVGANTLVEFNLRGGEVDFDVPIIDGGTGTNTGGRIYSEGYGYSYQTEAELAAFVDEIWGWNLISLRTMAKANQDAILGAEAYP